MKNLPVRSLFLATAIGTALACGGGGGSTPCLSWTPIQVTNPIVISAGSSGTTAVAYNPATITDFTQKLTIGTPWVTASKTGPNTITAGVHASVAPGLYTTKIVMDAVNNAQLPFCPDQVLEINVLVPGIPSLCEQEFQGSWTASVYPTGVGGAVASTTSVGPTPTERTHSYAYSTPGFHTTHIVDKSNTKYYQPQLQGAIGHIDATITGRRLVGTTFKQCDCMFGLVQNGKVYVTSSFSTNGSYVVKNWNSLTAADFVELETNPPKYNLNSHPDFSASAAQMNIAVVTMGFGEHAFSVAFEFDDVCATFYP